MNLFKILWVVTWAWSFLTLEFMEAVRGQKHYISVHMFSSSHSASSAYQEMRSVITFSLHSASISWILELQLTIKCQTVWAVNSGELKGCHVDTSQLLSLTFGISHFESVQDLVVLWFFTSQLPFVITIEKSKGSKSNYNNGSYWYPSPHKPP